MNKRGGALVKITYANNKVKKYFTDYSKMQRELPSDWVRTIKKHIDRLEAAECFGAECFTGYSDDLYRNRSGRSE